MNGIFFLFFILVIFLLSFLSFYLYKKLKELQLDFDELKFKKSSQSIKYGKMTEQWIPLMDSFPYNPENFRFLGSPIDGVAFTENKVVFLEFKAADSQLSKKQKHIKKLIKSGQVEWKEIRIN